MSDGDNEQALVEQYERSSMTEEEMEGLWEEFLSGNGGGNIEVEDPDVLLADDEAEFVAMHVAEAVEAKQRQDERDFHDSWAWDSDGHCAVADDNR